MRKSKEFYYVSIFLMLAAYLIIKNPIQEETNSFYIILFTINSMSNFTSILRPLVKYALISSYNILVHF